MVGVLYARSNDQWIEVSPPEVDIGPTDPLATNPDSEIWVDTSVDPPTIKANVGGVWTPIISGAELEVTVAAADPYVTDPTLVEGSVELWHDTTDSPGTFKARVNGAWEQVTQREVFVDDEDPLTRPVPAPEAELWYDTTTGELKVQHPPGTWTVVTAESGLAPDEVTVSPAPPRDIQTEMWVDTSADPAVFKYKDPATGAWVAITADPNVPAPLDEVWVGTVDPRDSSTELWYDVDAVPSTLGKTVPASLVESLITEVGNLKSRMAVLEAYVANQVRV